MKKHSLERQNSERGLNGLYGSWRLIYAQILGMHLRPKPRKDRMFRDGAAEDISVRPVSIHPG